MDNIAPPPAQGNYGNSSSLLCSCYGICIKDKRPTSRIMRLLPAADQTWYGLADSTDPPANTILPGNGAHFSGLLITFNDDGSFSQHILDGWALDNWTSTGPIEAFKDTFGQWQFKLTGVGKGQVTATYNDPVYGPLSDSTTINVMPVDTVLLDTSTAAGANDIGLWPLRFGRTTEWTNGFTLFPQNSLYSMLATDPNAVISAVNSTFFDIVAVDHDYHDSFWGTGAKTKVTFLGKRQGTGTVTVTSIFGGISYTATTTIVVTSPLIA